MIKVTRLLDVISAGRDCSAYQEMPWCQGFRNCLKWSYWPTIENCCEDGIELLICESEVVGHLL